MVKVKAKVGMYQATKYCESEPEGTVISIEDYDELVAQKVEEIKANREELCEWLSDNYTTDEVWDMTDEDKVKVRKLYEERCGCWARDDLDREWDYIEFETEVEVEVPVVCPCKQ